MPLLITVSTIVIALIGLYLVLKMIVPALILTGLICYAAVQGIRRAFMRPKFTLEVTQPEETVLLRRS